MKIILSASLLFFCLLSFGQSNNIILQPDVYLDSKKIKLDYYFFDPSNIEKVDVVKNASNKTANNNGEIFITSKNPDTYNFLTYKTLKEKYFNGESKPVLLLINGNFIKSPSNIQIDEKYIYKVEVESGDDFEELKNLYPNLKIVNIKLKNYNYKTNERNIVLHGMPSNSEPQ